MKSWAMYIGHSFGLIPAPRLREDRLRRDMILSFFK